MPSHPLDSPQGEARQLARGRPGQTLDTTALVHEARHRSAKKRGGGAPHTLLDENRIGVDERRFPTESPAV